MPGQGDFVANLGLGVVDPGVMDKRQHFAGQVVLAMAAHQLQQLAAV